MVELTLPYPPSANRLWVRARKGMRRSDRYEQWRLEAGLVAMTQRAGKVAGKYKLFIQAVRPDKRRRDIDNLIKPINDLMVTIGAVSDDDLCEMVTARWVTTGNEITVRIEPAGSDFA